MKNKFIALLTILLISTPCSFAEQGSKVISDSTPTQEQINNDLEEVNQYSNNLFTPHIQKAVKKEEVKDSSPFGNDMVPHGSLPPVKKLRFMIKAEKNKQLKREGNSASNETVTVNEAPDQALLDCETMQYFAPKTELQADGHVVMYFPQNNSTIKADKMIYNQTSNIIQAFGHVVLINSGNEVFGDYMKVDLNEENALMDKPITESFKVHAVAQKGYMYGDKLIQEQGSMYITKKTMIDVKSDMFGPDLDMMYVAPHDKSFIKKDAHGEKFKIKANEIIINSKKEHDTLTLKHAEIYFCEKKVGTIPSITMHTNKAQDYVEADFPEIGTLSNLGFFAGPGFVFDTPKGTTLKLVPMLNYQNNGDSNNNSTDSKLGFGSIIKFKSATNKTDMAYGTANSVFLMRGIQKLDDNMYFQYAMNTYMDDWFMGFRMPKTLGEVVYQKTTPFPDFLAKDRFMTFTQRVAAGYIQDGNATSPLLDGDGSIGTMRFKHMAEVSQNLWSFGDIMRSPINAGLYLIGQDSVALYGTGGTQIVGRVGPMLHSQYKNWMQDVGYFLSAYDDHTPLLFDRYMYGRSNAYLRESFRLCKYLTVSWFGSLNLSQDSWDGNMLQENGFYFAIGPDDLKLNIGYDSVRQQTFVTMAVHLDAKGSTVEYKKMTIKNPDTLGKQKDKDKVDPTTFQSPDAITPVDDFVSGIERAEVVDIKEAL